MDFTNNNFHNLDSHLTIWWRSARSLLFFFYYLFAYVCRTRLPWSSLRGWKLWAPARLAAWCWWGTGRRDSITPWRSSTSRRSVWVRGHRRPLCASVFLFCFFCRTFDWHRPFGLLKSWKSHVESVAACLTSLAGSEVQTWTLWSLRSQVQNLMYRFCQVPIQSKFSRANITRPIGCLLDLCFFKPCDVMDRRLVQSHYFKGERPFLPDWHANMTFEIANQGQTAKIENIRD